jgi:hypothetical protein
MWRGEEREFVMQYDPTFEQDTTGQRPLWYLCWKCAQVEGLVLISYDYYCGERNITWSACIDNDHDVAEHYPTDVSFESRRYKNPQQALDSVAAQIDSLEV